MTWDLRLLVNAVVTLLGVYDTQLDGYRAGLLYLLSNPGAELHVRNTDYDDPNQFIKRDATVCEGMAAWASGHGVSADWDSGSSSGSSGWIRDDSARCIVQAGVAIFEDDPNFEQLWTER